MNLVDSQDKSNPKIIIKSIFLNKYFLFEILLLLFIDSSFTIFQSPVIWYLAFKTHIVRIYSHSILLRLLIEIRILLNQFFVFFPFLHLKSYLVFQSLHSFRQNNLYQFFSFNNQILQYRFLKFQNIFTQRTLTETKSYSRGKPFHLKIFLHALIMENMSTGALDDRGLAQSFTHTYIAKFISHLNLN